MKDGNWVSNMTEAEIEELRNSRENKKAYLGERLLTEGLTYNLIKENPELMAKDLAKMQSNI